VALCERLALLAHMRLPCVLFVANPEDDTIGHCFHGSVCHFERENGQIFIQGDGFELRLKEQGIGQIHLSERQCEDGRIDTTIELHRPDGKLIARIGGTPEPVAGAVWQDLMDSFIASPL
jgi:putative heme degradation protein